MGLFFFIAGFFVPGSFDRQGVKTFCGKKIVRHGVPLVVFGTILSLVSGHLEVGHLWFLEILLVLCLLYALIRLFCKPIVRECNYGPSLFGMFLVALVMGLGTFFIRKSSPQNNWIWLFGFVHVEPAHILQYVMMFVLGIVAFRLKWLEKMKDSTGLASLIIGVALVIGNYLRNGGAWNAFVEQWYGFYESFLCVFVSVGLLWIFRAFCNWDNRFWHWCAEQSYGVYILHLFILLGIQYATDCIQMPVVVKFLSIGILTSILSYLITWAIRRIPAKFISLP